MIYRQSLCMQFTCFTVLGVVLDFPKAALTTSFKLLVAISHIFKNIEDFTFSYILKKI